MTLDTIAVVADEWMAALCLLGCCSGLISTGLGFCSDEELVTVERTSALKATNSRNSSTGGTHLESRVCTSQSTWSDLGRQCVSIEVKNSCRSDCLVSFRDQFC